ACKSDLFEPKDAAAHIPADVTAITAINARQLMQKADFEAVKEMEFYQAALAEAQKNSPAIAEVMVNPELSGIDLDKNIYITYDLNPKNPEEIFVATVFSIKDRKAFESLLKNADPDVVIEDKDGFSAVTKYPRQIVAWNDEIGVFGGANSRDIALLDKARDIFETKSETSIAQNKNLRETLSGKHDLSSWLSTDPIAQNPQAGMAMAFLDLDKDALKNNQIHSAVDFKDGQIAGHSDFFISEGLGENFIGKFFKSEIQTDFTKYIPTQNLLSATTLALDIRGMDEFLSQRPQTRDMLVFMAKDAGLEYKDLVETFDGDCLVALYGAVENTSNAPAPTPVFSTKIKNAET
ncbi:MAG: DUF4836 family protein, partial [Bacteroidetes bacterium]